MKKEDKPKKEKPQTIPGYRFNPFRNRQQRRANAQRTGYLKRDENGQNGWWRYRTTPENNIQTVVKDKQGLTTV
jgi:hypothetical protein